jgi:hypothetical protein
MSAEREPNLSPAKNSGVHWFLPGMKRPFAGTPVATSDLIVLLSETPGITVAEASKAILYDIEAQDILRHFAAAGYGDDGLADILANRVPRRAKPRPSA